jgi:alkanesulfonate monooxygenase SsuD/methylene tetrahydromethanopterin reductase-like flavin-dependent oxidoreductase (luciferase family)
LPSAGPSEVPIYINARQGEMLEAVGELIDGAILSIATPQWVREFALPRIAAGADRAGRPVASVDVAYHPVLCLHEDEQRAIDSARQIVAPYFRNAEVIELLRAYGFPDEVDRIEASLRRGDPAEPSDDLVRAITLVGPPEVVAERIAAFEAAGVTNMIIRPYPVSGESAFEATEDAINSLMIN